MRSAVDQQLRRRVLRHYEELLEAVRVSDVDRFLDWMGPDATFTSPDGAVVRAADTRPFWAWRFANVLDVGRAEIEVIDIRIEDNLLVVDFLERATTTVRGFDGEPVERVSDLENRNWWEVGDDRLTFRGGEELAGRRMIDGRPLTDEIDPWGPDAWARHRAAPGG